MKAQDLQFTQLLQGAKQFIIPIFQRTYNWEINHCEQLWNDIVRVGSNPDLDSHFIGSAVYISEKENSAIHWGNGNVEVDLENREDLPYIMGLVRQAFERQMAEEEIEI